MNLQLDEPCPRCGVAECFDGPFCEDCLGMVIMGLALLGAYGAEEKQATEEAVHASGFVDYKPERMRLIRAAQIWS